MAEISTTETKLAVKPQALTVKERAEKILNDWKNRDAGVVAEFLSTQSNTPVDNITPVLVEILNGIKDMPVEKKKELISRSCETSNKRHGYTAGTTPTDKGEQLDPEKYYQLLTEEKQKLAKSIKTQFKPLNSSKAIKTPSLKKYNSVSS